jgi:glycosyltransferase involved in cell wall biosynthesis
MDVTFLLPVRNGDSYIQRSLENIGKVARNSDEILVIDDGSTDGTTKKLQGLQVSDSRFNFIFTKGIGLVNALNLGLGEATNEVIARADVDDLYSFDRIGLQLPLLKDKTSAVFSDYEFFDTGARSLGVIPTAICPLATRVSLFSSQRTAHPSVIFRKSAVLHAGGYKEDDFLAEDLGLWIRLSNFSNIATCPEVLLKYTLHARSVSVQNNESMNKVRSSLLSKLIIRPAEWTELRESIPEIVQTYRNSSLGSGRMQLLLRDLLLAYRIGGRNKELLSSIQFLTKNVIFNPTSYPTAMTLLAERRKRRLMRDGYSIQ